MTGAASAAAELHEPGPREDFEVRTLTHRDVRHWYHVYSTRHDPAARAETFNEGWGDTRFAPIFDGSGAPVHTYYVASTPEAAYMESVLHDVALSPAGVFEVAKLSQYHLACVRLATSLRYVSFHTPYLPRLGVQRAQLIDSLPAHYGRTRRWSQAAYLQRERAQAVGYGSRRDDSARCLMLFKQRLPTPALEVLSQEPLAIGARRAQVLRLVRSLRLHEV